MNNKIALITGGTSGIGLAISRCFKAEGYSCILLGRSDVKLNKAYQEIAEDKKFNFGTCDVSNSDTVKKYISQIAEKKIKINTLVCCAGTEGGGITENLEIEEWDNIINTNLNSVFYVTKYVMNNALLKAGGSIINLASTGGKQGVVFGSPYSASKHGIVGFTKSLGLEYAKRKLDITVNAVCPGFVETDMAKRVRENYAKLNNTDSETVKKNIEARVPLGRYIQPYEVAKLVIYLASDAARGITAQTINICGGLGNY